MKEGVIGSCLVFWEERYSLLNVACRVSTWTEVPLQTPTLTSDVTRTMKAFIRPMQPKAADSLPRWCMDNTFQIHKVCHYHSREITLQLPAECHQTLMVNHSVINLQTCIMPGTLLLALLPNRAWRLTSENWNLKDLASLWRPFTMLTLPREGLDRSKHFWKVQRNRLQSVVSEFVPIEFSLARHV